VLLLVAASVVVVLAGCGPMAPQPRHDAFFDDDTAPMMTGDLDEAETRWRKDIAAAPDVDPDALLKDDPPRDPERYGNVAFKDPPPTTLWGKMKAGAETVGKVSFAALSVLVTLGVMAAPYLLL